MKFSQIATGLIQIVGIFSGTTAAQAASDPSVLAILSNLAQYIGKTVEGIALLQNATFNGNASDFFNISKSTTTFRAALADDTPDNSTNIAERIASISTDQAESCYSIGAQLDVYGPDLTDDDCVQLTNLFVTAVNMNAPFLADLREEVQYQSKADRKRIGRAIGAVRRACLPAIRSLANNCPDQVNMLLEAENETDQALNETMIAEGSM